MKNNTISQKQGIALIVMFIIGTSSIMVMGLEAKKDIWISILLALALSSLMMLVYAKLLTALPGKDFFEIIEHYFGKVGSKVILVLLTWFAFDFSSLVLRNYGQFVVTVGLPETPLVFAMLMMTVLSVYSVRSGIETIGRWSEQFVIYLLAFMAISVLLVLPRMDINNLLPVLDKGFSPVAKGTLGVVSFPFVDPVLFLLVFPAFKKKTSVKKVFLLGLLIGGLTIFISSVSDILVLGPTMAENMYYPTYATMATIHYGEFLQRFEVIAAIVLVISAFLRLTVVMYATTKGFARIFGFSDHRFITLPLALLILCFALFSFDNMMYYSEWTYKVWPYYSPIFQILIPLLLLIIIKIKQRKKGKKKSTR